MPLPREHLVDWLRDAHAMEQHAERLLQGKAKRVEQYPKLARRLERHLEQTREQQQVLEACLERLGASPSTVKDLVGRFSATAQTLSTMTTADETVKSGIALYTFAQLEVAAYTSLFAAAYQAGDIQVQQACERMLGQEEAMAQWLRDTLPELTQAFLQRDALADRKAVADIPASVQAPPER